MDKNFKKILSCFKKSILKLSGVNLHMTESKKFLLNFFTLEERTKAFSLTLFHSLLYCKRTSASCYCYVE